MKNIEVDINTNRPGDSTRPETMRCLVKQTAIIIIYYILIILCDYYYCYYFCDITIFYGLRTYERARRLIDVLSK